MVNRDLTLLRARTVTLADFFAALFPDEAGYVDLRALPGGIQRFFSPNDLAGIGQFIKTHSDKDLYLGIATRKRPGDGALANCAELHALFCDIDFKTIPEAEVRARLNSFPLPPSLIVRSGGGLHVYWLLREPLDLNTEVDRARSLLRRLAFAVGGDIASAEPARILRIPGTDNFKYKPVRRVLIEQFDSERRYNLSDFDDLLPPEPERDGERATFEIPDRIRDGSRNDTLYRTARSLRSKKLSTEAILAALKIENSRRCDPPLPDAEVEAIAANAATQPDRPDFHAVNGGESEVVDDAPEPQATPLVFPETAWRGPFAEYRAAMNGTSEAPDSAHFAALWAVAAARLRRRVSIHYAFTHYANVFLVNFGTTGDSKTSSMRQGLRLLPTNGSVRVARGVGSAEALGDWMAQSEDGARVSHLLFLEELGSLLVRGGWEGSTLLSFLTETFDAPEIYEIPFRKRPVKVEEPTPVLLAGTTPEWFWRSAQERDFHGGFGNRLFFLTGLPKPPIPMPGKPDPVMLARVKSALDRLCDIEPCEMGLSADALELWRSFYLAWKATTFDPLTAAATKRTPAYALKLALVYASFEQTAPIITADQLTASILVARFGVACAEHLIAQRRQFTTGGRCEEAVVRVLQGTDLPAWRIHHRIGGRFSAEDMARALKALMVTGTIIPVGKTHRGEPVYGLRGKGREA